MRLDWCGRLRATECLGASSSPRRVEIAQGTTGEEGRGVLHHRRSNPRCGIIVLCNSSMPIYSCSPCSDFHLFSRTWMAAWHSSRPAAFARNLLSCVTRRNCAFRALIVQGTMGSHISNGNRRAFGSSTGSSRVPALAAPSADSSYLAVGYFGVLERTHHYCRY